MEELIRVCQARLRPGGRLVLNLDHPGEPHHRHRRAGPLPA